jgi:MinD superfamily P-loop ATPase
VTGPAEQERPFVVAVASGKGGTGKTTVAVSLAATAPGPVTYADCDVEEPDGALFLHPSIAEKRPFTQPVPRVDNALCDGCGLCGEVCAFGAILVGRFPRLFPEHCHSCGACVELCPQGAIFEEPVSRGTISTGSRNGLAFLEGRLTVGEVSPTPLVRAVREAATAGPGLVVLDSSPGTSCPVLAAARGSDYLLLVTEPTPLGLSDLEMAVEMGRALSLPMGIVVNRAGEGDSTGVRDLSHREGVPLLASIPFDRRIASAYAQGKVLVEAIPELRELFEGLWRRIRGEESS